MRGKPYVMPKGVKDQLAFSTGYIDGRGERAKRPKRRIDRTQKLAPRR
jgi:hypothetical protein